jgi:hypothetical protein
MPAHKKLYCYVDETGQDTGSDVFIVVAVLDFGGQDLVRRELSNIEEATKVHKRKWFNFRSPAKEEFLRTCTEKELPKGGTHYGAFKKPTDYFLPMLEVVERAIKRSTRNHPYRAIVYVDGIDKKKAKELTGELRTKGITLSYVRSARDESEPLLRLADRWAGCIRSGIEGSGSNLKLTSKAEKEGYLQKV